MKTKASLTVSMASLFLVFSLAFPMISQADDDSSEHRESRSVTTIRARESENEHRTTTTKKVTKKKVVIKKKKITKKPLAPKSPNTQTGSTQTGSTQTGGTTTTSAITKTATVNYNVPEGSATVSFSVTVNNGVITAASSTAKSSGVSGYYQGTFAQGISTAAVGKNAGGLSLFAVGGASLTTTAFNQFVALNF